MVVKVEMLNVNVRFLVIGNCFCVYVDWFLFCICYNIICGVMRGKKEGWG